MFVEWSTSHAKRVTVNNHVHIMIRRLQTDKRESLRKYMARTCWKKKKQGKPLDCLRNLWFNEQHIGSKMIYGLSKTKYFKMWQGHANENAARSVKRSDQPTILRNRTIIMEGWLLLYSLSQAFQLFCRLDSPSLRQMLKLACTGSK